MTEQKTKSGWRRLLRFDLLTMLLLMLLCGVGVKIYRVYWYEPVESYEQKLSDGLVIRVEDPELADGDPDTVKATGKVIVRDRHGRIFCLGQLKSGSSTGNWTYYHPSGRKARAGSCRKGWREGQWTSWYANGRIQSKTGYGEFDGQITETISAPIYDFHGSRQGSAHGWWENGQRKYTGQFHNNRRTGKWKFWDDQGHLVSDGEFRDGHRHGPWRLVDSSGELRQVFFLHGLRIDDLDTFLKRLEQDIRSDDAIGAQSAIVALASIGPRGMPIFDKVLQDGNEQRKIRIVQQLAKLGPDARQLLPALRQLTTSDDSIVRARALATVFSISPSEQTKACQQLFNLAGQEHSTRQQQLIKIIASLGESILSHAEQLLRDGDAKERLVALSVVNQMILDAHHEHAEVSTSFDQRVARLLALAKDDANPRTSRMAETVETNFEIWKASRSGGLVSVVPVVG